MSTDPTNPIAEGMLSLLTPVVQECDERIQEVIETQIELATQIDMLTAGLFFSSLTIDLKSITLELMIAIIDKRKF